MRLHRNWWTENLQAICSWNLMEARISLSTLNPRNNQVRSSSIELPDDINRQDEWWTDMMNDDWKELLDDTTVNESHPKT
ncbi:protein PHOSPHATE STARVATION RESPONSE 1-like [Curcuma longa]|uniref:protein PHOSPHATE STARVATION RESPONSE 1-like n=1 Tax=Curcuma longa TaxID=136217 RepID=UPI003D9E53C0